ncbi:PHD-zinc-finger like domain-containing protein [Mycena pura]|uniref:PHD-zinc-finger like domain-containing protein n=1 Tax=Mycena pura TaxID=153505 RepID=A0AAD6YMN7_9AGAR|nr:PHD-zinc-finger like domain-containing protein [Mycena pura]
MEFLPPEDAPKGADGQLCFYSRVRLAWYYRPSDVSDRPVTDSRLLLAAIYSEVCDIHQLRAKCYVVHRDKISDLSGWKKQFEIIQATDCRNLPDNIRNTLTSRYEYVVAEKEVIPDLTDILRLCDTCQVWCPSADSVQCDRCKRFFHMRCVQPPLAAKPSRGYGWTCAPCSKRHEEEVDSREVRPAVPAIPKKTNAPAARGRGRPRKDRTQAEKEEKLPIKHFRLWPFRYFGLYPEDLIFPRTAIRLGPKFQANVPAEQETDPELSDQDERGGDNTVDVLSAINILTESEVEACKAQITSEKKLRASVDWLTEVIHRFSVAALAARPLTSVNMKSPMRLEKWKRHETRYIDKEWSVDEIAAFEDAIAAHGAELRAVRDEVPTRSIYEVVRFYGHWKCSKLGEQNLSILEHGQPPKAPVKQYKSVEEAAAGQRVGPSDDEGSVIGHPLRAATCGACRTRESKTWWKAPKGLSTSILCDTCGTNWRKYADLNNGPLGKVLKCKQCQFRVHAGACGAIVDPESVDSWVCDLCRNEETQEAALNPDCLLCPRERKGLTKKPPQGSVAPESFLHARKPTEGQGWTHVLCSVFIPELTFTDASRLRCVEGISSLSRHRWTTKCSLCGEIEGAVIRCSDCSKEYHASCAWRHGHRFGFEIQPVKSSRRETTITTTFKGESGCMNAIISCKEHDHSKRDIYGICETNEGGETALQVYCRAYKQALVSQAHGLLRKARRLDPLLLNNIRLETLPHHADANAPDPECYRCHTHYSPAFYPVKRLTDGVFACHTCHFLEKDQTMVEDLGMVTT